MSDQLKDLLDYAYSQTFTKTGMHDLPSAIRTRQGGDSPGPQDFARRLSRTPKFSTVQENATGEVYKI